MKEIAYRDWRRYEHSEFSARMALPFVQAQHTLDVTHLKRYTKEHGISFYFGLIWASTKVMEAREDFRWRLRGDRVVLIDSPEPSFTDLTPGDDLYKVVHAGPVGGDMAEYARRARAAADAQTAYFPSDDEEARDDYTYFSSLPLTTFSVLTQAVDLNKDHFIPGIAWSRYWEENGRLLLPYTMLCNHRLVDGLHIARYFEDLQVFIDALA